jgi:fatty acid desaturase
MSTVQAEVARQQAGPPSTDASSTDGPSAQRRGVRYASLSRTIRQAGLLDRRTRYYWCSIAMTVAMLAGGWTAFVLVGDSWWQLAVAVFLAAMFAQVGFLAHDAGHRQVFASRRYNDIAGVLLANLCVGLAYQWWVDTHNRHHTHPNQEDSDPDIQIPALAFTAGQAAGRGRLARLAYRHQAYFFFPLLLLTALGLHIDSAINLAGRGTGRRVWQRALFATHVVGYFAAVFLVLPPVKAVVFVLVQQGLLGLYLGCSFAPNHKGMPIVDAAERRDFLHRQVVTSRNVRGGVVVDLILGGLNYQIEHHLFPNMPRPNLRRARPIIRQFCRENGLPYCETGLVDSYALVLRHLHGVGRGRR